MGMEINEPRGHDEPVGINHLPSIVVVEFTDLGDLAVLNTDIGLVTRNLRPIDDRSTFHNSIELCHSYPPFWECLPLGLLAVGSDVNLSDPK